MGYRICTPPLIGFVHYFWKNPVLTIRLLNKIIHLLNKL